MNKTEYYHPPTYISTGDLKKDFYYSVEAFETDLSEYLPSNKEAKIVDVGCGWGQFLWWLKEKGYTNLLGIDLGKEQEKQGSIIGVNIVCVEDSTEYLENCKLSFDLVVMNHIIEHLSAEQGIKLLKAALNALSPGGKIIVQTPNLCSIGANWQRYIEITHITGYTEKSLSQIIGLAGFENVKLFGNKSKFRLNPRRILFLTLQFFSRLIWRIMLISEFGSDAPKIIQKNLYAVGEKPLA